MEKKSIEIPLDVKAIADFLVSPGSELTLRKGLLQGRKAEYFKGKHAVNALLRDAYQKKAKYAIGDRPEGEIYIARLLQLGLIIKVEKDETLKTLKVSPDLTYDSNHIYIWVYQGSQLKGMLMGIGVLLVVFVGVMFPLWPAFMRQGVYYLSLVMIGFLGFLMFLGVLRLIIWVGLIMVVGQGGWLFPNLFADVGVLESFKPVWVWDKPKKSKKAE